MLRYATSLLILLMFQRAEAFLGKVPENQEELVKLLRVYDVIKSDRVALAMKNVDRRYYTMRKPYFNMQLSIGYGAMLMNPYMYALILETLKDHLDKENVKVLDICCVSGYSTASMAWMVKEGGTVVCQQPSKELASLAKSCITHDQKNELYPDKIKIKVGDAKLGEPKGGPYDVIHVGVTMDEIPEALLQQLKKGGRMIIPVIKIGGKKNRETLIYDKLENGTVTTSVLDMTVNFNEYQRKLHDFLVPFHKQKERELKRDRYIKYKIKNRRYKRPINY